VLSTVLPTEDISFCGTRDCISTVDRLSCNKFSFMFSTLVCDSWTAFASSPNCSFSPRWWIFPSLNVAF